MADYRLHCFGESGHSYKVALTLELAGLDWEPIFVDYFSGAARTPEFMAINPMGELPVLDHGDVRLTQSGIIQDYIIEQTGQFGGANATERREIWRWVLFDNHKLSSQIGMTRFLANFIPAEKRPAGVVPFLHGRLRAAFKALNTHLDGRKWIVGETISVADLTCCGYLFYPEEFGFTRTDWPHIDAWLSRISEQHGWKHPYDLMPRAFVS